jgi:hypothetical protein
MIKRRNMIIFLKYNSKEEEELKLYAQERRF